MADRSEPETPIDLQTALSRPEVWAEPSTEVAGEVMAAILAAEPDDASDPNGPVDQLAGRRPRALPLLAAAAAVFVVAAIGTVGALRLTRADPADHEVALAGSQEYPAASAAAEVDDTPSGLSIVLEVDGLPPAPSGSFYAAWMVDPATLTRVPIGTFHLRQGVEPIELWSGVEIASFPVLAVTLQTEADPTGPSEPILTGRFDDAERG